MTINDGKSEFNIFSNIKNMSSSEKFETANWIDMSSGYCPDCTDPQLPKIANICKSLFYFSAFFRRI